MTNNWIKNLFEKALVDTNKFSAYGTRHDAVSTGHKGGVDIAAIPPTTKWAPDSPIKF